MRGSPNDRKSSAQTGVDRATPFCLRCEYDLSASITYAEDRGQENSETRCPECGATYLPSDPSTYGVSTARELARFTVRRAIPIGVIVALMVVAMLNTWIPIPSPLDRTLGVHDWRCWVWRGKLYGWEARQGGIERYQWASRIRGMRRWVDVQNAGGNHAGRALAWSVSRDGERWEIEVHEPGITGSEMLGAWNATRDRRFGLQSATATTQSSQPFTFEGDEEAVLTELADRFGMTLIAGWPRRPVTDSVWIWHPADERIVEVTRAEAKELIGYDPFDLSDPEHPEHVPTRVGPDAADGPADGSAIPAGEDG